MKKDILLCFKTKLSKENRQKFERLVVYTKQYISEDKEYSNLNKGVINKLFRKNLLESKRQELHSLFMEIKVLYPQLNMYINEVYMAIYKDENPADLEPLASILKFIKEVYRFDLKHSDIPPNFSKDLWEKEF